MPAYNGWLSAFDETKKLPILNGILMIFKYQGKKILARDSELL